MKTKLGISVGLMGAATYFMGLFSGYTVLTLFAGYILLFEQNDWLKKTAVRAFTVCVFFSVLSCVIGLIPNAINVIDDLFYIFKGDFSIAVVTRIVSFIQTVLNFAEKILLLIFGFTALHQGTVKFGPVDKIVDSNM